MCFTVHGGTILYRKNDELVRKRASRYHSQSTLVMNRTKQELSQRMASRVRRSAHFGAWDLLPRSMMTSSVLTPKPYHLHPLPYTLCPTPYTLHPKHFTVHTTDYTIHPTPCTLHPTLPTPSTLNPLPYTLTVGWKMLPRSMMTS